MGSKEQFIADLYPAALKVSKASGLSVELTLAQAAGETGWGEKILPGTHNLFNIKADPSWHGPTKTFHVWEIEHGKKVWKDQEFRVYGSYEESIADRAKFLKENPRYGKAGLFEPGTLGNLEKEADALKKAGYATDPHYATNMREIYAGRTMRHGIELATGHAPPEKANHAAPHENAHANATPASLKVGAQGERVHDVQASLIALGYAKQLGSTVADSKFGPHTEDAVRAFQRDHHLKEDGVVGKNTLNAMHEAVRAESQQHAADALRKAGTLADPAHAGHPVFRDALAGVEKIDAAHGRVTGQDSHQLAGAVAATAICTGMKRIDNVMLDENAARIFAVQGDTNSPFKQVASVDVMQGLQTPLVLSTQQAEQHLQQQAQQAAPQTQGQQQAQPTPSQPSM